MSEDAHEQQLEIKSQDALRSLHAEADRQADFYARRGNSDRAQTWNEIASLAWMAKSSGWTLVITVRDLNTSTPIIKGCEQVQQPPNNNVIKAFQ